MRPILLALLAILPLTAPAAVYKWVDAEGNVHFGDTPREGAEEVHVPPPQTYTPAPVPYIAPWADEPPAVADYTRFQLVSPAADATIRDTTGTVPVSFVVEPALKVERGHAIVVLIDGQPRPPVKDSSMTLQNVDRGTHTVQGRILDAGGKVLMTSQPVQIHLHRDSVLLPGRARPAPP